MVMPSSTTTSDTKDLLNGPSGLLAIANTEANHACPRTRATTRYERASPMPSDESRTAPPLRALASSAAVRGDRVADQAHRSGAPTGPARLSGRPSGSAGRSARESRRAERGDRGSRWVAHHSRCAARDPSGGSAASGRHGAAPRGRLRKADACRACGRTSRPTELDGDTSKPTTTLLRTPTDSAVGSSTPRPRFITSSEGP